MKPLSSNLKAESLDIVGSTKFGRYSTISVEQTFNMIISDGWLVPYAGYQIADVISQNGFGRGLYSSSRYKHMIAVIDDGVYSITQNLGLTRIASIETFTGDVFIDENNAGQIAICDKSSIYIFDYINNTFQKATLDFIPGYIAFQDGRFISVDSQSASWRLSDFNNGLSWPAGANNVGRFQTKPDIPVAAVPFPGKGNLLFLMGSTVTEAWFDTGAQLFPYQKNTYFNIDYGCLNPATVAKGDKIVVWLGANEKSGPVILYSEGGEVQRISNDGIDFRFSQLTNPEDSYGFLFQQDGHLIYQLTFPTDNLTLAYDFNTQQFFTLTNRYMDYHIAKRVVFFDNSYYFVSFTDGNLYEMSTNFTTYDSFEIPRVRVCKDFRLPDASPFVIENIGLTIEQGVDSQISRIDLSVSKNSGQSFSSYIPKQMNAQGYFQNRANWWELGLANSFVPQFRFWGFGRFCATNSVMRYRQ